MGNKCCQSGNGRDQTKAVEETKQTLQIKYGNKRCQSGGQQWQKLKL